MNAVKGDWIHIHDNGILDHYKLIEKNSGGWLAVGSFNVIDVSDMTASLGRFLYCLHQETIAHQNDMTKARYEYRQWLIDNDCTAIIPTYWHGRAMASNSQPS